MAVNESDPLSSEIVENTSVSRVFRVRKYYRNLGIIGLIFFTFISICSVGEMWNKMQPQNNFFDVAFACLMISFLPSVNLWILLAYKYESLTIQNESVIQKGVIFSKELDLSSVKQVRWMFGNGGQIKLKSLTNQISIHLDNFERDERLWLIRHFHSALPEAVQQNWDLFCSKVAVPLRDYDPDEIPNPGPDEILITRKRWTKIFIPIIFVSTILGMVAAWKLQSPRFLITPVVAFMLCLIFRYTTPKLGMVYRHDKATKHLMNFLGWWCSVGIIVFLIFRLTDFPEPQNTIAGYCSLFGWMAVYIVQLHRSSRAIQKRDLEKSKVAVQKWEGHF